MGAGDDFTAARGLAATVGAATGLGCAGVDAGLLDKAMLLLEGDFRGTPTTPAFAPDADDDVLTDFAAGGAADLPAVLITGLSAADVEVDLTGAFDATASAESDLPAPLVIGTL